MDTIENNKMSYDSAFDEYLKELKNYKMLSVEETKELLIKYHETKDEDIKNRIFEGNLRLVISCTKSYRCNECIHPMDLVQEGNMGLVEAIEKFDINRDVSFSTFAVLMIKKNMSFFVAKNINGLNMSNHIRVKVYKYIRSKQKFEKELNREPTLEEMAKYLNVDIEKIYECEQLINPIISINQKVNDEDDAELGDFIEDKSSPILENITENYINSKEIMECLNKMEPIAKNIILYRYGFISDSSGLTLEKTAEILYKKGLTETLLTRERIRQIETRALKKLRSFKCLEKYKMPIDKKNINSIFFFVTNLYEKNIETKRIYYNLEKQNYLEARKLLEDWSGEYDLEYFKYYGLLEKLENNYQDSIKNYNMCFKYVDKQPYIFLELAVLNMQLENFDVARKMLETYMHEYNYSYEFKINMSYLEILEGNYKEAQKVLKSINDIGLDSNKRYIITILNELVKQKLSKKGISNDYLTNMIHNYTFDEVFKHNINSSFINLKKSQLYNIIMENITDLDANHCGFLDTYKFSLNNPIGYIDGKETKDICVSTFLGTQKVVYIKPILLSNDFENDNKIYYKRG